MKEFVGKWFKQDVDQIISWEDFIDFYRDVSCSIERDEVFDQVLRNTWKL